ncbi:transposase [uncultured Hydrogenophaga sp.]|uniref:transposase n=1 Tax=uncultured Hydrogenophaga sp. TaxID=199683 RepID=UPI00338F1C44
MRKSRFGEEQIVAFLREAVRTSAAEAATKHMASDPCINAWRRHFIWMDVADVKRLKTLEVENARLNELLADRDLDIEVLKEINRNVVSPQARRELIALAFERGQHAPQGPHATQGQRSLGLRRRSALRLLDRMREGSVPAPGVVPVNRRLAPASTWWPQTHT